MIDINDINKELKNFGINLISQSKCKINYNGKEVVVKNSQRISFISKKIKKNKDILENLFYEVVCILNKNDVCENLFLDEKLMKIFIRSIKDLDLTYSLLLNQFNYCFNKLDSSTIKNTLEKSLDKDVLVFCKETILKIPQYKICIDWLFRVNYALDYARKLLIFVVLNKDFKNIKLARGIQGPWANLDLPYMERVFDWSDIEEDLYGRRKDIQRQSRYRDALEAINNDRNIGEGNIIREIRNDPYSFYNKEDNPYPHRDILWGK